MKRSGGNAVVSKEDPSTIHIVGGAEAAQSPESDPAVPAKKTRKGCLLLLLLLLLVFLALLFSGLVEEKLVPSLSERMTGYRVSFERSGINPLCLNRLTVQLKDEGEYSPPLLAIESLQIHWTLPLPSSGMRPLQEIVADHITVNLQDHAFPSAETRDHDSEKSSSFSLPPFVLPRKVRFENLSLHLDRAGAHTRLQGLRGTFELESLEELTAVLGGDHLQAAWFPDGEEEPTSFPEGFMEARMHWSERKLTGEVSLDLPGFLNVQSQLRLALDPVPTLTLTVEDCAAEGPLPGEFLAPFLPLPVSFTSLRAAPLSLEAKLVEGMPAFEELSFDLVCTDLTVGLEEEAWYRGDVTLSTLMETGEGQLARWTLPLNRQQKLEGTLQAGAGLIQVHAGGEDWPREALLALLPASYKDYDSFLPVEALKNFSCHLQADSSGMHLDGKLNAATTAPFSLTAHFQGEYEWAGTGNFSATLKADKASLGAQADLDPLTGFSVRSEWKDWPLSDLIAFIPADVDGSVLDGLLTGQVVLTKEIGKNSAVKGRLHITDFSHDSFLPGGPLAELSAEATAFFSEDFSLLHSLQGSIEGAEVFSLSLTGGQGDLKQGPIKAALQAEVDLLEVGTVLDKPELWGSARCEASFSTTGWRELLLDPCVLTVESLGYGDYSLPYGEELILQSPARLSLSDFSVSAGPVEATLGETTRLHSDELLLHSAGLAAEGKISFSSDFSPLVAKQWLDDGDGNFSVQVEDFLLNEEGLQGTVSFSLPSASLTFPQSLAQLTGLSAEGHLALAPSLSGEASFSLEEGRAAGITVQAAPARLIFQEGIATIETLRLGLLGGRLDLSLQWEPQASHMPLTLRSTLDHIDLGVFTEEFKPSSLVLTGIVRGEVSCVLTPTRLREFNLMLESTENFSMNRDMVEQLLLNQYMDDVTGGRQMGRMIQSVLGKKAQTAFDCARLTLGLEEERIAGVALLESKSLNLTVDIKADPPALLEALRVRQEQSGGQ